MKFETPKMNISMFAAENVATAASSILNSNTVEAAQTALTSSDNRLSKTNTIVFTF